METTNAVNTANEAAATTGSARARRPIRQVVLREMGEVGRYRVRVVKASEKPESPELLDIREYVRGANYEGFTRKGVRLGIAEARALRTILEGFERDGVLP
ncbi:MAG: hypothetical protein HYY16_13005 [Planctomycetes bacterium]|nr:hypothetical protein [Planctomycetota bacterium]